jgi:hypothetical protein
MGLRGKGATPLSKRALAPNRSNSWDVQGLNRADRVIAFCKDLTVTSGIAAYTKLQLRPWQRKFTEAVYAENKQGVRPVRTAVLSMERKNGKTSSQQLWRFATSAGPKPRARRGLFLRK